MRFLKYLSIVLLVTFFVGCTDKKASIHSLHVEMQENPEGLTTLQPRFSWQISSKEYNTMQQSYQIQVAASLDDLKKEQNLLWNSSIIKSDQSHLVSYDGEQLSSRGKYYWRVKVATNQNDGEWSGAHHWTMALLNDLDWQAKWIGEDAMSNSNETDKGDTRLAARYLRKLFQSKKKVKRAMIYISGMGLYEAYINGKRISDDVLSPAPSWYPERVYYNTYDVTTLIKSNKNILSVVLGNGRYFGMRESSTQVFGLPRLLTQLEIEYFDGTTDIISTDETWKVTSRGPIVANNEFDGEEYDARLELIGWNEINYDDSNWKNVDLMDAPKGKLVAQPNPNIRVQGEISPIKITELDDGKFILDMGQNMVGWLKVNKLRGEKGKPISFRFAELINSDGTVYLENMRTAKVTDIYTPAKDGGGYLGTFICIPWISLC